MNICCRINFLFLIFFLFISACGETPPDSTAVGNLRSLPDSGKLDDLRPLLDSGKLDDFYKKAATHEIGSVRRYFEDQAKSGKVFNYGVLVNANIITPKNRKLFKPDLKEIKQFIDVPNLNRCYMNSALYNVANSEFFDPLFELDHQFPEDWKQRPSANVAIANSVIATLREVIYEIRLGLNTTPDRIANMRARHLSSFDNLGSLETSVALYQELFASYDFELMEYLAKNDLGEEIHQYVPFKTLSSLDHRTIKAALENSSLQGSYSALSSLSASCSLTNRGNTDLLYLDAIFSVIDPWGRSARYLSLAKLDDRIAATRLNLTDAYGRDAVLKLGGETGSYKFMVFHNEPTFAGDLKHFWNYPIRTMRNPTTKNVIGAVAYLAKLAEHNKSFSLIAKSKVNSNHVIAEFFRHSQNSWEQHRFFGPPTFSKTLSAENDGTYKDFLYYFVRR